jgi:hypothetical protein
MMSEKEKVIRQDRQSVFVCGFLSGLACAYTGFFSIICGMFIGIFIQWSTVFETDLNTLSSKIKFWTNKIILEEKNKNDKGE